MVLQFYGEGSLRGLTGSITDAIASHASQVLSNCNYEDIPASFGKLEQEIQGALETILSTHSLRLNDAAILDIRAKDQQ